MRPTFVDTALRSLLWLLLGGWVGAWFLFAFGVAMVAFRVLAVGEAGLVVGPILAGLHFYGGAAGAALALLAAQLGRGRWAVALPLVLGALCLWSELVVTAEIDGVRPEAFGPEATIEASERFGQLHRRSMQIFTGVGLGAIGLIVLHAAADARAARGGTAPRPPAPT